MTSNEVVVLSTFFDQKLDYAEDFFRSLDVQSFKSFDILIVNDGFKEIDALKKKFSDLSFVILAGVGNIAKNRELLINSAIARGYKKAVFADFDDYFSSNRLALAVQLLEKNDLVVNDLTLVASDGQQENYLSSVLIDSKSIFISDILECNFIGMSNTSINLLGLEKVTFDKDLKAVDWFFFSTVLLHGARAVFTSQCVTYYRQHDNNLSCIGQVTIDQLKREIDIKLLHYSFLTKFTDRYDHLLSVIKILAVSGLEIRDYFNQVNHLKRSPFWWNIFNTTDYWRIKNEINRKD